VGIVPPPPAAPFSAFTARLETDFHKKPNHDAFHLQSEFTLGQNSNRIDPLTEPVTLQIGPFTTTIPAGSFNGRRSEFKFHGKIDGVHLHVEIEPRGAKRYALEAAARHASLTGTKSPAPVTVAIGDDTGSASVRPYVHHDFVHLDDD
jgi:hypothetical protein